MALTNEEIDERFEIDARQVIRWRRVSARGMPRWCQAKADEINRKAGEEVNFFRHSSGRMVVKIYDCHVTDTRIRKVLQRQTGRDVALTMERSARKRARADKAERSAKPGSGGGKAWADPADQRPELTDRAAIEAWELREYERMVAWRRAQEDGHE
jgi:hypothetical protein